MATTFKQLGEEITACLSLLRLARQWDQDKAAQEYENRLDILLARVPNTLENT